MTDFSFLTQDLLGLLAATALAGIVVVMPGYAAAAAIGRLAPAHRVAAYAWAPLAGIAVLPILVALAIRAIGLDATLAAWSVLGLAGLAAAARARIRPAPVSLAFAASWLALLAFLYVDFDRLGQLNQSLLTLDLVKHAAVVRTIAQDGLPLADPFFLRPEPAGYYHYFYDLAALVDRAGGSLVDARMAFVGTAFWCWALFPLFLRLLIQATGWWRASERRLIVLSCLACCIGGLDLLGIALRYAAIGVLEGNAEWWNDEISLVPTAASWVPHHLSAVIAAFAAVIWLLRVDGTATRRENIVARVVAGFALASCFGLSVWIALGAGAMLLSALRTLPGPRRRDWLVQLCLAGAVAALLSLVQFSDLLSRHTEGSFPLALWIREPARAGELLGYPLLPVFALLLTPLAWFAEFGLFAIGSLLFLRRTGTAVDPGADLARVLTASAVSGLLLNLLVRSTIINNDFGWRVAWFAAVPAMVWTITALQHGLPRGWWRGTTIAAGCLGLMTTLYSTVGARMIRPPWASSSFAYINRDPADDHAARQAYEWAGNNLSRDAVLQHDPAGAPRVLNFGLYGHHRVSVADREAMLFGADREDVARRLAALAALFADPGSPVAQDAARKIGVTHVLLPAGRHELPCLYRNAMLCIAPLSGAAE